LANRRRAVLISSIALNAVFVIVIAFLSYRLIQPHQEPQLYSFDLATDEFYIRNVEMAVYPDSIYVGDQYLERNGDERAFDGISYGLSLGGHMVASVSQADDPFILPDAVGGRIIMPTGNLIKDVKVITGDRIDVTMIYTVDGQAKNFSGHFLLSEVKRPYSWIGPRTVVQLSDQGTVVKYANQSTEAASTANNFF